MKYCALLLAGLAAVSAMAVDGPTSYDGHKVLRIPLANQEEGRKVLKLIDDLGLDVWKYPFEAGDFADVSVAPGQFDKFQFQTASFGAMSVMHNDLGLSIAQENNVTDSYEAGSLSMNWYASYHSWKDHMTWLKDLSAKYPKNSAIVSAGKSGEGNDIAGIHIHGSAKGKKALVFQATIHAREWIVGKTVEYIAQQLLEGLEKDEEVKAMLEKHDVFIYPFMNPDGFIFTSGTRMWRKNRSDNGGNRCKGTDCNRNWTYKWGGAGASADPCHETFRGASAGSEPETKAAMSSLDKIAKEQGVDLFIDWHSYGQMLLSPYGYTCSAKTPRESEHQAAMKAASDAIKAVDGKFYKYGGTCNTLYAVSGGSNDYAIDVTKAGLSIVVESRDTGSNGFIIPAGQIEVTAKESWAGVKAMVKTIK